MELNQKSEVVELKVKDNGRGFSLEKVDITTTSGLKNIKERIRLLGGELQIISNTSEGTHLISVLPVWNSLEMVL